MLTKQDLQAIDNIIVKRTDEIVTKRVDEVVVKRINEMVPPLIQKELKPINKKIDLIISFFDREYTGLRKRVERIEDHLHLPAIA
jgi:hypothetical protein